MNKKMYNKPEMKIVFLRHRTSLLQNTATDFFLWQTCSAFQQHLKEL